MSGGGNRKWVWGVKVTPVRKEMGVTGVQGLCATSLMPGSPYDFVLKMADFVVFFIIFILPISARLGGNESNAVCG